MCTCASGSVPQLIHIVDTATFRGLEPGCASSNSSKRQVACTTDTTRCIPTATPSLRHAQPSAHLRNASAKPAGSICSSGAMSWACAEGCAAGVDPCAWFVAPPANILHGTAGNGPAGHVAGRTNPAVPRWRWGSSAPAGSEGGASGWVVACACAEPSCPRTAGASPRGCTARARVWPAPLWSRLLWHWSPLPARGHSKLRQPAVLPSSCSVGPVEVQSPPWWPRSAGSARSISMFVGFVCCTEPALVAVVKPGPARPCMWMGPLAALRVCTGMVCTRLPLFLLPLWPSSTSIVLMVAVSAAARRDGADVVVVSGNGGRRSIPPT